MRRRHAFIMPLLVIGTLLAVEAGFRLAYFGWPAVLMPWRYTPVDTGRLQLTEEAPANLRFKLRPNLHTLLKGKPFTTNSAGFREREIPQRKPPGVYRIAVLGTSICMGSGVGDDEIFSRRLQARLDASEPGRFEVLNFAVSGYRLPQMLATYNRYAKAYDPDVIMLPLFPDRRRAVVISRPAARVQEASATDIRPKLEHLFAYQAAREAFAAWQMTPDWAHRGQPKQETAPPRQPLKALAPFLSAREQEGVTVLFTTIPVLTETGRRRISERTEEAQQWSQQFANVHVIDMRETLWPRIQSTDYIYYGDAHLNAHAHEEIAGALFDQIHPLLTQLVAQRRTKVARAGRPGRPGWRQVWAPPARPAAEDAAVDDAPGPISAPQSE